VTVGLGTDAACPYSFQYGMWRELCYFHKYVGVSNSFALKTGTIINARILGKDKEIGSIAEGKYFDAILLDKDPFIDLKVLSSPLLVFKKGYKIKHKNKKLKKFETILDTLI
jgi:Imidazolonepropionase and related amidohydrolases